jgi:hypothetical protein
VIRELVPPIPVPRLPPGWICWEQGQIVRLARLIQAEEGFEDMPILADALEDAGIDDPRLLSHCREPRRHDRECWALELLLAGSSPLAAATPPDSGG